MMEGLLESLDVTINLVRVEWDGVSSAVGEMRLLLFSSGVVGRWFGV